MAGDKSKVVRRPDFAGGGVTPAEQRQLDAHAQLWIARILRTEPADPTRVREAICGLYRAARLREPRVIVVPGPLVMALAGGVASAIWAHRACATYVATDAATRAATDAATYGDLHWLHEFLVEVERNTGTPVASSLSHIRTWSNAYAGGNMWAQYDCYLTACRDVLGLRLPVHEAYRWWEMAAIEGGFRFTHSEFCLVSDFPEVIRQDEEHRPHCADGPSHRWRDGWELFHWHGVPVPRTWIVGPKPTAREVLAETNAERRRAGMEIIGWDAALREIGARTIDVDADPQIGALVEVDLPDAPRSRFIRVRCATGRDFALPVPQEMRTALEANAWTYGIAPHELRAMQVRT